MGKLHSLRKDILKNPNKYRCIFMSAYKNKKTGQWYKINYGCSYNNFIKKVLAGVGQFR